MDIHRSFRLGAENLVRSQHYDELHRSHGIMESDWDLLTQEQHWTADEARQVRGILAQVIEVSMTICGMPAIPLPAQYCAAVIAIVVAPANRMVACTKVPDTFDAFAASGLLENFEVRPCPREQMISLVMAYSGGFMGEPPLNRLPTEVNEAKKKAVA
jgi:hypothetical protein